MTVSLFDLRRDDDGRVSWRGYSPDTTDEQAAAAFRERFGVPPERILRGANVVLAGPVPEAGKDGAR